MRQSLARQICILLGFAFVPGIGQAIYFRNQISWRAPMPASDLASAQAKNWGGRTLWLDARPNEQFSRARYSGALPLNEDDWNAPLRAVMKAWSPEKYLVVYCSTRSCGASRVVAQRLRNETRWQNVFVLEGGWEALQETKP